MSNASNCITWLLQLEDRGLTGRVTVDAGGRTRFGIAEKDNSGLPADFYTGSAAAALDVARAIYLQKYWYATHACDFSLDPTAAAVLSFGVNTGASEGIKIIQTVLGIAVDGKWGPQTIAAVEAIGDEVSFTVSLRTAQAAHYKALGGPDLPGWLNRVYAVYPSLP